MSKRVSLLLASVAAFAFAIPAAASAAPSMTMPAGTLVPKGTNITYTSTNVVVHTPIGTVGCSKVTIPAELTENTGTSLKSVGLGAGTSTDCTINSSPPEVKVTDLTTFGIVSTVAGKGTIALTFEIDFPGVTCHFSATALPFTYTAGSSFIKVSGALTAKPASCSPASLTGDFEVETTAGGAIILD